MNDVAYNIYQIVLWNMLQGYTPNNTVEYVAQNTYQIVHWKMFILTQNKHQAVPCKMLQEYIHQTVHCQILQRKHTK